MRKIIVSCDYCRRNNTEGQQLGICEKTLPDGVYNRKDICADCYRDLLKKMQSFAYEQYNKALRGGFPDVDTRKDKYEHLGDLSATPPWHSVYMECHGCKVSWLGCWGNFMCPRCLQGELPNNDNFHFNRRFLDNENKTIKSKNS